MARPWQENVDAFDVLKSFKQHNIELIINLQEVRFRGCIRCQSCCRLSLQYCWQWCNGYVRTNQGTHIARCDCLPALPRRPPPQVGEHSECGPGNLPCCGFTYRPEQFMAARVGVVNLSWRDMGVPTLERMMDIVQVGRVFI